MAYTLIFGNNFIDDSPKSITYNNETLLFLDEDSSGPFITTQIFNSTGENLIIKVERNICSYCSQELVEKHNDRSHLLLTNKQGEIILQSRILDKKTILVSGKFSFKEFVLIATQNYIILPNGKKMMHNRARANDGSVKITADDGIKPEII
ncbi:MAG TPA: hypothetical protein VE089_06840 [Nitrososphaeraceae archaeon]|jgi:hypothetical protein|nr:hypothetical protein [Nitrososphaeraceae archaeon]